MRVASPRTAVPRRPSAGARLGRVCAGMILLGGLLGAARADDEATHPKLRDFLPTGQYVLVVEAGLVEDGKIYHSESAAAYLAVSSAFEFALLVLPRRNCVESVSAEELIQRDDGGYDVRKDATPCSLGRFWLEGADVVFRVNGKAARLRPKPPLEGGHLRQALLDHSPEYGRAAKEYRPDPKAIERLKAAGKKVRIQVFFGSWCSFCNRVIPYILRVEQELENTELSFEYFGLPAPPAAWVSDMATRMGVKRLPTGVLFVDGREIGRVIGTEWFRPETSLLRYLR